jgi:hypothetical protein
MITGAAQGVSAAGADIAEKQMCVTDAAASTPKKVLSKRESRMPESPHGLPAAWNPKWRPHLTS